MAREAASGTLFTWFAILCEIHSQILLPSCLVEKRVVQVVPCSRCFMPQVHFLALNLRNHLFDQLWRRSRSSCSCSLSVSSFVFVCILMSSANMEIPELMISGRSLINRTKSIGPRTEPCGTPLITSAYSQSVPLTLTFCLWLVRNSSIHSNKLPAIPYV